MEEYSLLTSEEDFQVASNTGCTDDNSDVNQSCEEVSLVSEDDELPRFYLVMWRNYCQVSQAIPNPWRKNAVPTV